MPRDVATAQDTGQMQANSVEAACLSDEVFHLDERLGLMKKAHPSTRGEMGTTCVDATSKRRFVFAGRQLFLDRSRSRSAEKDRF